MEPGIKEFFKRITSTVGLIIICLAINMVIGIRYGYAFFDDGMHWYNILFYLWVIVSFIITFVLCLKIWKEPIEHLND